MPRLHGSRIKSGMTAELVVPSVLRSKEERLQIAKDVPQPQEEVASGFLIWNDWPIRSST